jgi:hypothetical protein
MTPMPSLHLVKNLGRFLFVAIMAMSSFAAEFSLGNPMSDEDLGSIRAAGVSVSNSTTVVKLVTRTETTTVTNNLPPKPTITPPPPTVTITTTGTNVSAGATGGETFVSGSVNNLPEQTSGTLTRAQAGAIVVGVTKGLFGGH